MAEKLAKISVENRHDEYEDDDNIDYDEYYDLECAAAGDHVAAVAGGIQACTEDGTVPQIVRQCKLSATAALTLQL